MPSRLNPETVIPQAIESLELCYGILETTEGIGWDILNPLKTLIRDLKTMHDERQHHATQRTSG